MAAAHKRLQPIPTAVILPAPAPGFPSLPIHCRRDVHHHAAPLHDQQQCRFRASALHLSEGLERAGRRRRSTVASSTKNGTQRAQADVLITGKEFDIVALSNLCVDIVLQVDELPPNDEDQRVELLQQLTASDLNEEDWEVGGCTNFLISAARLGMHSASIGHVNDDRFGSFLARVLQEESIPTVENVLPPERRALSSMDTLLCFVLVDGNGRHAFCSRYDHGPWPLLEDVKHLPEEAMQLLRNTRAVYVNGFCFDELRPDTVIEAVTEAEASGAAVFFDPGPRCFTLLEGERRSAMDGVLDHSTCMLVTLEEGTAITGETTPELVAHSLLNRKGNRRMEWVVVKDGGRGAALVTHTQVYKSAGFTVDVADTVGCGDSFAAAVVLGYIRQLDINTTLKLANAVGAATATRKGAGRNVGDPATVKRLLAGEGGCSDALALLPKATAGKGA